MAINTTNFGFNDWEEKFCYLWKNREEYALVKGKNNDLLNYSIFSLTNYFFVMLDVDIKIANLIINKMIESNVTVFESLEDFNDYTNTHPIILPLPIGYPSNKEWVGNKRF